MAIVGPFNKGSVLEFDYVNYREEAARRTITVIGFQFGSNDYHPEEQMFIQGFCHDRKQIRTFACKDISNMKALYYA